MFRNVHLLSVYITVLLMIPPAKISFVPYPPAPKFIVLYVFDSECSVQVFFDKQRHWIINLKLVGKVNDVVMA